MSTYLAWQSPESWAFLISGVIWGGLALLILAYPEALRILVATLLFVGAAQAIIVAFAID
jgi:hypothetical protein